MKLLDLRMTFLAALITSGLGACSEDTAPTEGGDTNDMGSETSIGGPVIAFSAPRENHIVAEGVPLEFVVECSHPTVAPTALEIEFTSSRAAAPLGKATPNALGIANFEVSDLAPGLHTITATVSDPDNRRATATLDIKVNSAPSTPVIALSPERPEDADDIAVTLVEPSVDAEGDDVSYTYRWLKNGEESGLQNPTLPAAATTRGEVWKVFVTPSDGLADGLPASAEVSIDNTPPSCASATLLPSAGTTTTSFTCACSDRTDPDLGDPIEDVCTFQTEDGPIGAPEGSCTLDPALTTRGQRISCLYYPADGFTQGAPATSPTVDVLNSAPTLPSVTLSPASANADTTLTCNIATPATDADDDPITYAIEWLIDDKVVPGHSSPTLRAGQLAIDGRTARRGDSIRCQVFSDDGTDRSSTAAQSAPITLENAAPTSGMVLVQVEGGRPATVAETLACVAVGADSDQDELTPVATWKVNDLVVPSVTIPRLNATHFDRGDTVTCTLIFTDGITSSPPEDAKNQLTIKNALPTVASVALSPAIALLTDTFTCAPQDWSDADSDPPEYAYAWFQVLSDGDTIPIPDATAPTLSASTRAAGDVLRCQVTPKNGSEAGLAVASNDASVKNTPPTLASATLAPAAAYATTTLTCTPNGFSDLDGHSPNYKFAWTRNGTPVLGALDTLSGPFTKGDRYRCVVTPNDGIADGPPATSNEVAILNSLPSLTGARVTPVGGGTCAAFKCEAIEPRDADPADIVGYATTWIVNGTSVGNSLATVALAPGDTVACRLAPTDGTVTSGLTQYGSPVEAAPTTVTNQPPSALSASITPSDAGVGDIVRCVPAGYSDDCTNIASWNFDWFVDGAPIAGVTTPTFDTKGTPLNASVTCRATPRDPFTTGAPVESSPLILGPGDAVPPVVALDAPSGADGEITCRITEPEEWFINPTYTYFWQINDQPEFEGDAILAPQDGDARHCDIVTCRLVVTDDFTSLSSNKSSLQMPVGADCEDGNDCTSTLCDPAGGCGDGVLESGIPCVSDDPCQQGECLAGICQGLVDLCTEEPIAVSSKTAFPASFGNGGYAVLWDDTFRLTSWQDSRLNENRRIDSASTGFSTYPLGLPDGSAIVLSEVGTTLIPNSYGNATTSSRLDGRYITAAGETSVVSFGAPEIKHSVGSSSNGYGSLIERVAFPLLVSGNPAVLTSARVGGRMDNGAWSYGFTDIFFAPSAGTLAGQQLSFVTTANYYASSNMHGAVSPPDGSNILVAWVPSNDPSSVWWWIKSFTNNALASIKALGTSPGSSSLAVDRVRVAARTNGGWIIAVTGRVSNASDTYFTIVRKNATDGAFMSDAYVRVNTVVDGNQTLGNVASFSDGGFVIVWNDSRVDGLNNPGVMAQRFTVDGLPEGPQMRINTFTTGTQTNADVSVIDDDEWVVTWNDQNLGMIMTRRYYRDGTPVPGPRDVLVASSTVFDQKRPAGARTTGPSQTAIVVWDSPIFIDDGREISYRMLGSDGRPVGMEMLANTKTAGDQINPAVAGSTDRYLVAWETVHATRGTILHARYLDSQGNPLGEPFDVSDTGDNQKNAAIVALPASVGGFAIAWQEGTTLDTDIRVRRFLANGQPAGPAILANSTTAGLQSRPTITALSNGTLVVGWQTKDQYPNGGWDIVRANITLNSQGDSVGEERAINGYLEGALGDRSGDQTNLTLLASPTGFLASCWQTTRTDASVDLVCQTFTTSNFAVKTSEFPVAVKLTGVQTNPALAIDATGSLVVIWESEGIDTAGRALLLRRMSIQGPATGIRVMPHRYAGGDQTEPWLAPFADGSLWVGWESSSQDGSGTGVYARLVETE